jgi:polysaccharide export outer membrane protein
MSFGDSSNLPVEKIGNDDLIGITVYDSPELTRAVRVNSDGDIRLPMLQRPIRAAGLYPSDLERAITTALIKGNVLVNPVVTVSMVEYRSRPIIVSGAVKNPLTFQATGTVTLLDAIARAGGLSEDAGSEILLSRHGSAGAPLFQRIPVNDLMAAESSSLNVELQGGEEIRVPEAGRIFVLGEVKKPGSFFIRDGSTSSVMKALALSEGLDKFPSHEAYIYRVEGGSAGRNEIPVDLKKIMKRKSPDVPLMANDILYVPSATGTRVSLGVLEATLGLGGALGAATIYATR